MCGAGFHHEICSWFCLIIERHMSVVAVQTIDYNCQWLLSSFERKLRSGHATLKNLTCPILIVTVVHW